MNVLFDGSYKSKPLVSLGGAYKNVSAARVVFVSP